MIRIGIVGSDNGHGITFSQITNIPDKETGKYAIPDVRITSIFGYEEARTKEVAEKGQIENIVEKPEDMIGNVDAVMVVFRHGDLHLQHALPFIEKGIPIFIDKPFTVKVSDAKLLAEACNKHNALVVGGSTIKHTYDVLSLKNAFETNSAIGKILGGYFNYPANIVEQYAGIHFYGNHNLEAAMAVFGYDIKSVKVMAEKTSYVVLLKYDNYQVVLNYIDTWGKYVGIVYGEKGAVVKEIEDMAGYKLALEVFAEMIRTSKKPYPVENLVKPVIVLNAVEKSIKTGQEVFIEEIV